MARGSHPVGEHVWAEDAQLHLDGDDLGVLDGLVDGGRGHLAEGDTAQQAPVDVLLHRAERLLHGHLGVAAGTLEDVELLTALEQPEDVVDGALDTLA
jgi:hypothetical protein